MINSTYSKAILLAAIASLPYLSMGKTPVSNHVKAPVQAPAPYKIDTLYYDANQKHTPAKEFSTYARIIMVVNGDSTASRTRKYYTGGGLYEESGYLSIDTMDDTKSRLDGDYKSYYKSGKELSKKHFDKGVLNGEEIVYFENGLIKEKNNYQQGVLERASYHFTDNGYCRIDEYTAGEHKFPYYTVIDANGYEIKYNYTDDRPYLEIPRLDEMKTDYRDGIAWNYYNKNGVLVSTTMKVLRDYGKYWMVTLFVANNTPVTFDVDPLNFSAKYVDIAKDKSRSETVADVLSEEEYMGIVKRRQNWEEALVGISLGATAVASGYSYSTMHYHDGPYYGSYTAHSYNALAAFQSSLMAGSVIADMGISNYNERNIKREDYLKRTTLNPGDCVVGNIKIPKTSSHILVFTAMINGCPYVYSWTDAKE